jgi:hypothetical protein
MRKLDLGDQALSALALSAAICFGMAAGYCSRTDKEAWLYCALFCAEALLTGCTAGFLRSRGHQEFLLRITLSFLSSAICAPIYRWISTGRFLSFK